MLDNYISIYIGIVWHIIVMLYSTYALLKYHARSLTSTMFFLVTLGLMLVQHILPTQIVQIAITTSMFLCVVTWVKVVKKFQNPSKEIEELKSYIAESRSEKA